MSDSKNITRVREKSQHAKPVKFRYKKFRDFCVRFSKFCSLSQISKKLDKENKWVNDFEDCSSSSFDTLTLTKVLKKIVFCNLYNKIHDVEERKRVMAVLMKFCLRVIHCKYRKIDVCEVEEILDELKMHFKAI